VNIGSLSDIMVLGKLWSLKTLSRYALATFAAVIGCCSGIKWAYFVNLSTTTMMQSAELDWGRPSIKSMVTVLQAPSGVGNGSKSPGVLDMFWLRLLIDQARLNELLDLVLHFWPSNVMAKTSVGHSET
jgi:hypothetical protein